MSDKPVTWTEFLKAVSGATWTLIKSANWRQFEPLPPTVEFKYRVVYWHAWHYNHMAWMQKELRDIAGKPSVNQNLARQLLEKYYRDFPEDK